jgi:meso-butanediol dehydrogenase / (S,S)-butanediol dehydrogenase / diacetyl reductase
MSKIVVITGAGSGLGRAIARRLAGDGDTVVLLARSADKIEALASEIGDRALAVRCDVSLPDSVRTAFATIAKRHPKIDVLINNAAIYEPCPVAEASDEHITSILATNVMGPVFCARAAIPMLVRGSLIINVSSESIRLPFPFLVLYRTSKAALEEFSATLHRELEPNGIRVSTVRAGMMRDDEAVSRFNPEMARRFGEAALAAGLNLRARPISHFNSVTDVFRAVIDMPADVHALTVVLSAYSNGK